MLTAGLVVMGASVILYGLTLHPSVAGGDSGELMCVAHELATPHPPGYPTFAFTTKAAEWSIRSLLPDISVGYAQNLFHGFLSCIANALLAMTGSAICDGNTAAGVLAGILFGFSPNVWTYAVSTEVFPLNNVLSAGLLLLVVQFYKRLVVSKQPTKGFVYFAAFFCGLALTNQHTTILFVAPIALWVFFMDVSVLLSPLRLLATSACFFLGLSPYVYLPLSATYVDSANSWGKLNTLENFMAHFLREEYGTFSLASKESTYKVSNYQRTTVLYFKDIYDQLGLCTVLACVGLAATLVATARTILAKQQPSQKKGGAREKTTGANKKNTSSSKQKETTPVTRTTDQNEGHHAVSMLHRIFNPSVILLLTWALYINFFNYLSNLPIDQPLFYGVQQRFWLQPLLIVCVFMALGLDWLQRQFKLPRGAVFGLIVVLASVHVSSHFAKQDESQNYYVRDFGRNILRPLPENAILLTKGDLMINSARFAQCNEGFRPDVTILDQELMTFPWYNKAVAKVYPHIVLPGTHYFPGVSTTYDMKSFLDKNRNPWKRRVFLAVGWKEGDPSLQGHYVSIPFGLASEAVTQREKEALLGRVDGKMSKLDLSTRTKYAKELAQAYPNASYSGTLPPVGRYPAHSWEAVVLSDCHHSAINIAFQLLNLGEQVPGGDKKSVFYKALVAARKLFLFAMSDAFEQHNTPSYVTRNLGVVCQKLVEYDPQSVELIEEAKSAFEAHLVALKAEGGSTPEGRRPIEDAVQFYSNRLGELKRKSGE